MTNPATSPSLRAFIAINLPDELKAAIERRQRALAARPGGRAVRWISAPHIHLTLRFLGEVPAASVEDLAAALRRATAGTAPLELSIEGAGCFPNARQPRIIWLGVTGATAPLQQLQGRIQQETAAWGKIENRPFAPHLTIGRIRPERSRAARPLTRDLAGSISGVVGRCRVEQVDLMQSRLAPTGAEYSVLAEAAI